MRKTVLECVYDLARDDERIFFIGSDLGESTMDQFKRDIPGRFFMEGISEANIIGMAAGMALEGKIPYVNTIATFLTRRCFEQVAIDLCLHNVNVRLIGNGGGMVYAPLGPTHLAIEDLAILRALPNMTILAPADAEEMRRLMPLTVDYPGPIYIRLAKGYDPVVTSDSVPFQIGKGQLLREGTDALIVTTGIALRSAQSAAEDLANAGVEASILHMPTLKPFDSHTLLQAAEGVRAVVSVEEHTIIGGLGSAVAEVLAEACFERSKPFRRIGIPDVFPDEYGSQDSLMEHYNITAANIAVVVRELLNLRHQPASTTNLG